jgi:hypothetical protein
MSDQAATNIRFLPLSAEGAWRTYLQATKTAEGDRYQQVEQAAWEQLQATLADLPADPVGAA